MKQKKHPYFDLNLLALSAVNTNIASALSRSEPSKNLILKESRSGKLVPILRINKREVPLHSQFDPEKEGSRFYSEFKTDGYIIFLGFGAGYHILPFLQNKMITEILIIDKDLSLFKSIVDNFNLTRIFLDKRVKLLIDPKLEDITKHILDNYIPAVSGNLHILKLRSRIETEKDFFPKVIKIINNVITPLSEDFSVQSYFGKKWFINTLNNLKLAEKSTTVIPPIKKALIIGAGPSLEGQIKEIAAKKSNSYIISTDTAYSSLVKFGIKPDLIISIDCQPITFFHFPGGIPEDIPVILDLASPSNVTRLPSKVLFFTSGHPFSLYLKDKWRNFPFIDTSGGNVSHAAVSLAYSLGAKEIYLYGVDFSYPGGKSYARGSYLYSYFSQKSNRISPLIHHFTNFLFHNQQIDRIGDSSSFRYVTKPMISYKNRLEELIQKLDANIIHAEGEGERINTYSNNKNDGDSPPDLIEIFSAGPAKFSWKTFLKKYYQDLSLLPLPDYSLSEYMQSLTSDQKEICTTIFPAAAVVRRELPKNVNGAKILTETIEWTRNTIRRYLS